MKHLTFLIFLFCTVNLMAKEANNEEVEQLKAVIKHNLKAMNEENIKKYMSDIHPKSPAYEGTKNLMNQLFQNYDLKASLVSFKPIAIDEDLFITRSKQKTVNTGGKLPFKNNIVDAIHVYKKVDGGWLLWSSMILDIKYIK